MKRRKGELQKPVIEYTYPQLLTQTATPAPGSKFNRQGGSVFNRRRQGSVAFELDGWDRNLTYPVRYTLKFSGVSSFDQDFPKDKETDSELGDLGYWECDLVPDGVEVQMLFVSSAEFRIVFSDFEFQHARTKA